MSRRYPETTISEQLEKSYPVATVPRPKRIVIYRLGSIGDTIVALPCFHGIARAFPHAERIVLTNFPVAAVAAPLEAVLGKGKLVSRYVTYPINLRSIRELLKLRKALAALETDTLIYLAASRGLLETWRDFLFFRLCGIRHILGIPLTRDLQCNRIDPKTGFVEPECERLARTLTRFMEIDLRDQESWDLLLDDDELAASRALAGRLRGTPFIAIHVGGKVIEKNWGESNWRALLADLARTHGDHGLMLLGAAEDAPLYGAITTAWSGPILNEVGNLTPRQCAAVLRAASLFIGHDSGPLHLAAVSGASCVGLFGSYNLPRKWHPYVGKLRIIHRMQGVTTITVHEVAEASRELLAVNHPKCETMTG
jgi:heptosyltransferase-3